MGGSLGGFGGGGMSSGGGSGGGYDPTTGQPVGPSTDFWGGNFGTPSSPATTEQTPQVAQQSVQSGQPVSTPAPTGQQSGTPDSSSLLQQISSTLLGGGSPKAQEMQTAATSGGGGPPMPGSQQGPGWIAPAPAQTGYTGWPNQPPGAAGAAVPGSAGGVNPYSQMGLPDTATISPQSSKISGENTAVAAPATPAPAPAPAPAAAANPYYPDVAGSGREAGAGPPAATPTTANSPFQAQGGGVPPALQDLFSLNFGRFIADLLGQQGAQASTGQPAPSGAASTTAPATGDSSTQAYDPTTGAPIPAATSTATPAATDTATAQAQQPKKSSPAATAGKAISKFTEGLGTGRTPAPAPGAAMPEVPQTAGAPAAPATPGAAAAAPASSGTPGATYNPTTGEPIAAPSRAPAGTTRGPAFGMGTRAPERSASYDPTTGQPTGTARGSPFSMGPAAPGAAAPSSAQGGVIASDTYGTTAAPGAAPRASGARPPPGGAQAALPPTANIPPNAGDRAVTQGRPPTTAVSGTAPPSGTTFNVGQYPASDQWVSQQHIGLSRNGGSDTAPTTGYSSTMREVRAARFSQMTPQDRILMYGMMQAENERDPIGPMESLANRSAASKLTMGQLLRSRFYGPGASFERRGSAIAANPRLREHYDSVIAAVQNGSNVLGGATDQGSGRDPNVGWRGGRVYRSGEIYNDWGGGRGHFGNAQWRHEVQARVQAEGRAQSGTVFTPGNSPNIGVVGRAGVVHG